MYEKLWTENMNLAKKVPSPSGTGSRSPEASSAQTKTPTVFD